MKNIFNRSKLNPILVPDPRNWWESKKLYNPGAIFHNGKYHLFYRAVGGGENWKSSIGYAVSSNGESFERFDSPLLEGIDETEVRGLEDPRIIKIDDKFFMTYAAYDGITPRLCVATSDDLRTWKKYGHVFTDWKFADAGGVRTKFVDGKPITKAKDTEWSKSGAIFPEKIDGRFAMLFGEYRLWFAYSADGIKWEGEKVPFLSPRPGDYFDNTFVEMGPPPIKTEKGWLVIYHGINHRQVYRIGLVLLDLNDPKKILFRSDEPIFEPAEDYEMSGMVDVLPGGLKGMQKMLESELKEFLAAADKDGTMPRVTFCCGAVVVDGVLRIYYGASDSVICTASAMMDDVLGLVKY